jgi:hypothetical protein
MVLHPLLDAPEIERTVPSSANPPLPAWTAVEQKQKQPATEWLLITQVDHAQLAGDLAARLQCPLLPQLDEGLVRAISSHDAGWAGFDAGLTTSEGHPSFPRLNDRGKPLSFLEATPAEFVVAWTGSIDKAEKSGPAGGIIVSGHFCRLAEGRLTSRIDNEEDTSRFRQFLHSENARQQKLVGGANYSSSQLHVLTDVLQFCDLLSLYLCCGASEPVHFPQEFGGTTVSVCRDADLFRFQPRIFGSGVSLGIGARLYTQAGAGASRALAFLLD